MANRYTINGLNSFNKGLTFVEGQFTVGSAGAVSSYTGSGVSSITKTASAGSYTINLEDGYKKLLSTSFTVMDISDSSMAGVDAVNLCGDATHTNDAAPYIKIQTLLNNALADPASGAIIRFALMFRNSSLKGKGE